MRATIPLIAKATLPEQQDSSADHNASVPRVTHVGAPNGAGHMTNEPQTRFARATSDSTAALVALLPVSPVPPSNEDAEALVGLSANQIVPTASGEHPANDGLLTTLFVPDDDGAGHEVNATRDDLARPATLLNVYASAYESAQKLRMAQMNRIRCWLRDTLPREQWGDIDFTDEALNDRTLYAVLPNDQREFVDGLMEFEKAAARFLGREIRKHHLWPWFEGIRGIGEVLAGRMLHHLGDLHRFPSPAHLWSYCGLDGPDWKRRTEEGKKTYSPKLNVLAFQISGSFQHQPTGSGGYRDIYDRRKAYEATKPWCGTCHPKGDTMPRETCTPGHINNKARRFASKRFLADLWEAGTATGDLG